MKHFPNKKTWQTKPNMRKGLRVRGNKCNEEVRRSILKFANWARKEFEFPIRVVTHLSQKKEITTIDGKKGTASFFAPFDKESEPFIRLATGDFLELKKKIGRDDALASIICSFAHEIVHYQQWVSNSELSENGVNKMAIKILRAYSNDTNHP